MSSNPTSNLDQQLVNIINDLKMAALDQAWQECLDSIRADSSVANLEIDNPGSPKLSNYTITFTDGTTALASHDAFEHYYVNAMLAIHGSRDLAVQLSDEQEFITWWLPQTPTDANSNKDLLNDQIGRRDGVALISVTDPDERHDMIIQAAAVRFTSKTLYTGIFGEPITGSGAIVYDPDTDETKGLWLKSIGALGNLAVKSTQFAMVETTLFRSDPILLDLNGDGIKTTDLDHGVMFDHDNNGFQEWSAWVDSNDGMLVADLNNNGIIDNGTELLGNHTVLPNGSTALDGYAALADYDSNTDSVINSRDQKLVA